MNPGTERAVARASALSGIGSVAPADCDPVLVRMPQPVRGRGAVSRPAGRFDRWQREPDPIAAEPRAAEWSGDVAMRAPEPGFELPRQGEDGFDVDAPDRSLPTRVLVDQARSLITYNRSPDLPFDRTINPYRGCEHGCSYCYARPGHAWLGHSPGLDFESLLYAKHDAAALLRRELSAPSYRCATVHLGSATDAWQPIERRLRLTRAVLEVLTEAHHPVTAITKSSLIERDIDLLAQLAREGQASVYISITTLDAELSRAWEPRAAAPWRRLQTIRRLAEAGIPVGVALAPVVPFLNEPEIERILEAARAAGASRAFYSLLRLPHEVEPVFCDWLQAHRPDSAARILARIGDMRSTGSQRKLNDSRFGRRFKGKGHWADLVAMRFKLAARRLGLGEHRFELDASGFAPLEHWAKRSQSGADRPLAPPGSVSASQLALF